MNRSKQVVHTLLTIYHDFEQENKKYRGSVSVQIYPTYTQEEIQKVINEGLFSAGFVKNEPYPLVKPVESAAPSAKMFPESNFTSRALDDWLKPLVEALFKEDRVNEGGIDSAELFQYYLSQSSAENVYKDISQLKLGESIQGDKVTGDTVNLSLEPYLPNSTLSAHWDEDGFPLKPVSVFEKGDLMHYWGPFRFTHYLDSKPAGNIKGVQEEFSFSKESQTVNNFSGPETIRLLNVDITGAR